MIMMMMIIIMNIIYYYYYYYIYIYIVLYADHVDLEDFVHTFSSTFLLSKILHLRPCGSKCWRLCRWGFCHLRGLQSLGVEIFIQWLSDFNGCGMLRDVMGMSGKPFGLFDNVWLADELRIWFRTGKPVWAKGSIANFFSILTFDIRHWSFWRVEVVHQERVVHSDLKAGAGKSARWDRDSEFVLPLWSPLHIPQRHDEIRWILSHWRCSCLPRISKLPTGFQTFQSRCLLICQNPKLLRTTTKCNQLWLCLHSFDFFVHLSGYSLATSSWWSSDWSWSTLA